MKRLLDESTDELTRSLLSAGVEHRPPAGNKAQVIMALGAGSAVGLFSSNAFAWLGTTAGKVTAAGVAVGLAGAVFVAAQSGVFVADPSGARGGGGADARALRAAAEVNAPAEALPVIAATGRESAAAAEAADLSAGEALEGDASRAEEEQAFSGASRLGSSERRHKAWARKAASKKRRGQAPENTAAVASEDAEAAAGNTSAPALVATVRESALDTEVRLVDDMHGAARRNDNVALERYVEAYRASFPDGQLKKEVAELAARLERSDTP